LTGLEPAAFGTEPDCSLGTETPAEPWCGRCAVVAEFPSTVADGGPALPKAWPNPSRRWIIPVQIRHYISAAPPRRHEFGPRADGPGRRAVASVAGRTSVPVGDQRERISGGVSHSATGLPDHCGWVEARLLGDVAVVRTASDQDAAVLAGHARLPPHGGPTADQDKIVDEPRTPNVTGREHKRPGHLITAVRRLVDRVGARVEQGRIHVVVVQKRPVRVPRHLHQPNRRAQRVPARRTPETLHRDSVALQKRLSRWSPPRSAAARAGREAPARAESHTRAVAGSLSTRETGAARHINAEGTACGYRLVDVAAELGDLQ
jgi:hypothetical protein